MKVLNGYEDYKILRAIYILFTSSCDCISRVKMV